MQLPHLEHEDLRRLQYAIGWIELGNPAEALAELDGIAAAKQNHSGVLGIRWRALAEQKNWEQCLEVAARQVASAPGDPGGWLNRSYSLRRSKAAGLRIALDSLVKAREKFPVEPVIPYNMACYECQLGNHPEAMKLLREALAMRNGADFKQLALNDSDLRDLWPQIRDLHV